MNTGLTNAEQRADEARDELAEDLERVRDEAKARLQAAIGEATVGVLPDGAGRYSWKQQTQQRPAQEAKTVTFRALRRLKG